jgi:hypothetical protein
MSQVIACKIAEAQQVSRRSRRVVVLLCAIVLLSIADLTVTLAYLRGTGMMEANPLAAFLIRWTQSSLSLVCFKLLTVGICVSLLYKLRRNVEGELAAWCGVAILVFMSVQWRQYAENVELPTVAVAEYGDDWLVLD